MEPSHPTLDYTADQPFGWRRERDGWMLILPPRPARDRVLETLAALAASTGTLLIFGIVAYGASRSLPPEDSMLRVLIVLVGLVVVGQWVLVVLRVVGQLRHPPSAGHIAIEAGELRVSGGQPPGLTDGFWPLTEVAAARLHPVRGAFGVVRRATLIVRTTADRTMAYAFNWPTGVDVEPVAAKFQELLAGMRSGG